MAVAFQASGSAFRINTQTLGNQEGPDVAVLSTGGFVVVWEDHNEPLTNANIKGQIYAASGAKFAGEFLVNTQTTGNQVFPAVTGLSSGRFVVTWTDGSGIGVGMQGFDFRVPAAVAGLANGGFLVAFQTG